MKRFLGLILLTISTYTIACDDTQGTLVKSNVGEFTWLTLPTQITVSEPFSVVLHYCEESELAQMPKIKAWMPKHNHGMNYQPSTRKLTTNKFLIEGFVFHMPGQWQFLVDLKNDEIKDTVEINVSIP